MLLLKIQQSLKVPKSQFNDFGKYKYRSAEDILEAVKPVLKENNAVIILTDEAVYVGQRHYIKATATITDGNESYSACAFAREEETKKGMDASQITGSCSSYARKYAMNALLAIDDTKDSDSTNTHDKTPAQPYKAKPNHEEWAKMIAEIPSIEALQEFYFEHETEIVANKALIQLINVRKSQLNG